MIVVNGRERGKGSIFIQVVVLDPIIHRCADVGESAHQPYANVGALGYAIS
jgi:hypothetical protein